MTEQLPSDSPESTLIQWDEAEPSELTKLGAADEREPTRLKWVHLRPRPPKPDEIAELREQLAALGLRVDHIEAIVATLVHRGVNSFNGRSGEVIFNGNDLASVDGATRAWVLNELANLSGLTDIDGGTY